MSLGLGTASHPNLHRFLSVHRAEQAMQLANVQQEQQALIGVLSERAPQEQLERLVEQAMGMKEGKVKAVAFYTTLEQTAREAKIDLASQYPRLAAYITYVQESDRIDATTLADELAAFVAELRRRLATTAESRQLMAILDEADLLEKLLGLRLSPEEYRRLQAVDVANLANRWEQFLNAQLARQGQPRKFFPALRELEGQLSTLRAFYEVAQQRDEQLVKNAVAKLRETGEPIAVLITGGFHSPTITRLLTDQGLGTVVLTPKVSSPTNERLYHAVVKYKSGRGSFDEVMAIANEQAPSPAEAAGTQ
jgi:hypothetical protein